jgi:cellulose synthase/poly-beta-1,6-N-acetylglucosamine synthase-like glycosyltransferase
LDKQALRLLVCHFDNPLIGAVAGNAKVGNRRNLITKLQALEYVTSQNFDRLGLARMNGITVVPGAIGAWRSSAVAAVGGLNSLTLAEDCDLTMAIQRLGYKIAHENRAIAWTEAPATWSDFMKQRFRWIYGTLQCAVRHSDMILRREPRALALYSLPSIFLFNLALPVISPLMDLLMVWGLTHGAMELMHHPQSFDLREQVLGVLTYLVFIIVDAVLSIVAFSREPNESNAHTDKADDGKLRCQTTFSSSRTT